jgi:hypothetical protein
MKLAINEPISQKDPRWSGLKLGNSNVTIGGYGCNLCCHSMLVKYYGYNYNPDALNELYKQKGVFQDQNLINYWKIPEVFPDITCPTGGFLQCPDTPAPLHLIDEYLNNKMPVICLVDFDKATQGLQTHFVLIIGKEAKDYLVNDPATGETYWFSAKYGPPAQGIMGLRLYQGIPPSPEVSPTDLELEKKIAALGEKVAELQNGQNETKVNLEGITRKLDGMQNDITQIYKDRDLYEEIKNNLAVTDGKVNSLSAKLDGIVVELKQEIRGLTENTIAKLLDDVNKIFARLTKLENQPVPTDGLKVIFRIGGYIVGRKV